MFDDLLHRARQGLNDNDLMRLVIRDRSLHSGAISIPIQAADALNSEKVMEKVENVIQSEENLSIDQSFEGKQP